jgi:hypothetical protein
LNVFINYFRCSTRRTCLNLSLARFFICCLGAWKLGSSPYAGLATFPEQCFEENFHAMLAWLRPAAAGWIQAEQAIGVACLILCAFGVARRFTAFGAALILSHLEGVALAVCSDKTASLVSYFLIFYGMFSAVDTITWDALRKRCKCPQAELSADLAGAATPGGVRLEALAWFLVTMAAIYFLTGFGKWRAAGWGTAWGTAENMRLALLNNAVGRTIPLPPLGEFLCSHELLLALAGRGTLILEFGFLVAVLAGLPITPFVVGLIGMHVGILYSMEVNYLRDMGMLHLAFLAWDSSVERLQRRHNLVVFHGDCRPRCLSWLLLAKHADVTGGLRFIATAAPTHESGGSTASGLCVVDAAGCSHTGSNAVVLLLTYLGFARPIARLLAATASCRSALACQP